MITASSWGSSSTSARCCIPVRDDVLSPTFDTAEGPPCQLCCDLCVADQQRDVCLSACTPVENASQRYNDCISPGLRRHCSSGKTFPRLSFFQGLNSRPRCPHPPRHRTMRYTEGSQRGHTSARPSQERQLSGSSSMIPPSSAPANLLQASETLRCIGSTLASR